MRKIMFRAWDIENERMVKCNHSWFAEYGAGDEDFYLVKGFEVMLCTGLKDRRGKYIFEGDILKCTDRGHHYNAHVEYVDHGFWIVDDDGELHFPNKEFRIVVGNIYEDWDLIQ